MVVSLVEVDFFSLNVKNGNKLSNAQIFLCYWVIDFVHQGLDSGWLRASPPLSMGICSNHWEFWLALSFDMPFLWVIN